MLPANTTYGDKRFRLYYLNLTDSEDDLREPYKIGDEVFLVSGLMNPLTINLNRYKVLDIKKTNFYRGNVEVRVESLDIHVEKYIRGVAGCLFFPILKYEPKMEEWKDKCPSCGSRAYINGDSFMCVEGC